MCQWPFQPYTLLLIYNRKRRIAEGIRLDLPQINRTTSFIVPGLVRITNSKFKNTRLFICSTYYYNYSTILLGIQLPPAAYSSPLYLLRFHVDWRWINTNGPSIYLYICFTITSVDHDFSIRIDMKEAVLFALLYSTYFLSYISRKNIIFIAPHLAQFGFTKSDLGASQSSFTACYLISKLSVSSISLSFLLKLSSYLFPFVSF